MIHRDNNGNFYSGQWEPLAKQLERACKTVNNSPGMEAAGWRERALENAEKLLREAGRI